MEEILRKLENKETLSEEDLWELTCVSDEEIDGKEHRWQREISSIIKYNGKYYRIDWMRGLTENQENEFDNQPYEVVPQEKVITIKEWVKKEG